MSGGEEHVIDCHVDSNNPIPWSGEVIRQKSAGDSHHFARLFSYSLGEVVAALTGRKEGLGTGWYGWGGEQRQLDLDQLQGEQQAGPRVTSKIEDVRG